MWDSLLILYNNPTFNNPVVAHFSTTFMSYYGINFVITMDNDVKIPVTLAIFQRLIKRLEKIF